MRLIKWLALTAAIGSLLTMVWLLSQHHGEQPQPASHTLQQPMMEQPVIIENRGEEMRWKLKAAKAEQGLQEMYLTQPQLELFNDDGYAIPIRGDRAWFNPIKRSAHFVDNVTIDYQQWHLQSAEALFEGSSGKLHIAGKFSAQGDSVTMHGEDLTIDQPHQRLEVRRHISIKDQR